MQWTGDWHPAPGSPTGCTGGAVSAAPRLGVSRAAGAGTLALIDAIVGHPELEAAEVTEDTDLSSTADLVNPPASPNGRPTA